MFLYSYTFFISALTQNQPREERGNFPAINEENPKDPIPLLARVNHSPGKYYLLDDLVAPDDLSLFCEGGGRLDAVFLLKGVRKEVEPANEAAEGDAAAAQTGLVQFFLPLNLMLKNYFAVRVRKVEVRL